MGVLATKYFEDTYFSHSWKGVRLAYSSLPRRLMFKSNSLVATKYQMLPAYYPKYHSYYPQIQHHLVFIQQISDICNSILTHSYNQYFPEIK